MGIDWMQASIAGVVGGLIGGLYALGIQIYGRLAPRLGRLAAAGVGVAVVAAIVAAGAASPLRPMAESYVAQQRAEARFEATMAENMMPLLRSPALQARLEGLSQEEANALVFRLSADGQLRLSDEELIERADLLGEAIAQADEDLCAAQLLGASPEQVQRLLLGLPEASLRDWARLSAAASQASLRDAPRRTPTRAQVVDAYRRMIASLPERDGRRLAAALEQPAALEAAEACWTTRAIFRGFEDLPAAQKPLVARVLATQ